VPGEVEEAYRLLTIILAYRPGPPDKNAGGISKKRERKKGEKTVSARGSGN
jgi:hypothetical protein